MKNPCPIPRDTTDRDPSYAQDDNRCHSDMIKNNKVKQRPGGKIYLLPLFGIIFALSFFISDAKAITVGPVKLEYSADPGDTIKGEIFVQNEDPKAGTATFYPVFEKFTEDGGNKIFTAEESDLSTWFRMAEGVTLKPQEYKYIPFKIVIPTILLPFVKF